jgi:tetratricopeptide (TPR) repeat protein
VSADAYEQAEAAYAEAMELYVGRRDFAKAQKAFEGFLDEFGEREDVSDLADRARVHLRNCAVRLSNEPSEPREPEDWLLRAVALANVGQIDAALEHFDQALEKNAPPGRVHYSRAAALAMVDRQDEALEALRLAIDADPANRAYSLGDPDFERLRESAGYAALIDPPSARGGGEREHGSQEDGRSD